MTTHTPGPWTVDAMGFVYATADSELPENSNQGSQLVLAKLLSHSTVRTAGNASLIAAAPDLLDALMRLVYTYEPRDDYEKQSLVLARAAIRKAKGE